MREAYREGWKKIEYKRESRVVIREKRGCHER
jgi:hypothetical protein